MHMRRAIQADLDDILDIYKSARAFMRASGNPNQWGNKFPEPQTVRADIVAGHLWVCVDGTQEAKPSGALTGAPATSASGVPAIATASATAVPGAPATTAADQGRGEELLGCLAFLPGPDPNYARIYDGVWPNDDPYYVAHRVAVLVQGRGVGGFMMDWALEQAHHRGVALRIDTHRQNLPMQGLIRSRGLAYCGVIRLLRDGSERLSYSTL